MKEKTLLALKASEDISDFEIANIVSQISMYGIKSETAFIDSYDTLYKTLHSGKQYDYIYLATHGCETSWGNISGSLSVTWIEFAAMVCHSGVTKPGSIFLHSCCRGGLNKVAWEMFACCDKIQFICGPRQSLYPVDIITAFNIFLYNVEVKRTDPVIAAEKVLHATDIRLVCFDRLETTSGVDYHHHCNLVTDEIKAAFEKVMNEKFPEGFEFKLAE